MTASCSRGWGSKQARSGRTRRPQRKPIPRRATRARRSQRDLSACSLGSSATDRSFSAQSQRARAA